MKPFEMTSTLQCLIAQFELVFIHCGEANPKILEYVARYLLDEFGVSEEVNVSS